MSNCCHHGLALAGMPCILTGLFHSEALVEERRQLLANFVGDLLTIQVVVETGLVQQFCVLEELLASMVR